MVRIFHTSHEYAFDFSILSQAFFLKYPNPFSKHVSSCDTIEQYVDGEGRLVVKRLIRKKGRLPSMLRFVVGSVTDTWTLESSVVDPKARTLTSWVRNLDHTKIMRVDDYSTYEGTQTGTRVLHEVRFKSGLTRGIREKLEDWGKKQFVKTLENSREGLHFAVRRLQQASLVTSSSA